MSFLSFQFDMKQLPLMQDYHDPLNSTDWKKSFSFR